MTRTDVLEEMERYLHTQIPLTHAMQLSVIGLDDRGARVAAPLAPNINHRNTVFGGSAANLGILAAWALLRHSLREAAHPARIVIQRSRMDYLLPLHGDFEAFAPAPAPEAWEKLLRSLDRRGRGRILVAAELFEAGDKQVAGRFEGAFVIMSR